MDSFNCLLLVVILIVVVVCCMKKEDFQAYNPTHCKKDTNYNNLKWFTDFCNEADEPMDEYNECRKEKGAKLAHYMNWREINKDTKCRNKYPDKRVDWAYNYGKLCNSSCVCPPASSVGQKRNFMATKNCKDWRKLNNKINDIQPALPTRAAFDPPDFIPTTVVFDPPALPTRAAFDPPDFIPTTVVFDPPYVPGDPIPPFLPKINILHNDR